LVWVFHFRQLSNCRAEREIYGLVILATSDRATMGCLLGDVGISGQTLFWEEAKAHGL